MKNAIVTGYSSGIGEAIALELEKNGFNIIKLNSRLEDINSLEKEIKENPLQTLAITFGLGLLVSQLFSSKK